MGGGIAQYLAVHHGNRVATPTLMSTSPAVRVARTMICLRWRIGSGRRSPTPGRGAGLDGLRRGHRTPGRGGAAVRRPGLVRRGVGAQGGPPGGRAHRQPGVEHEEPLAPGGRRGHPAPAGRGEGVDAGLSTAPRTRCSRPGTRSPWRTRSPTPNCSCSTGLASRRRRARPGTSWCPPILRHITPDPPTPWPTSSEPPAPTQAAGHATLPMTAGSDAPGHRFCL
jgi:hypothetical protein